MRLYGVSEVSSVFAYDPTRGTSPLAYCVLAGLPGQTRAPPGAPGPKP